MTDYFNPANRAEFLGLEETTNMIHPSAKAEINAMVAFIKMLAVI